MRTYLYDIADTDERPRTDTEGNWLLTSLSIVLMLPTLIASFYGMNVDRIVNA